MTALPIEIESEPAEEPAPDLNPFAELGLSEPIVRAVAEAGYRTPTPIQAQAIPHVLRGQDVLGCAQTGTGKTASFTLPMIEILAQGRARARMPRSLILEPTRELAAQVAENFEKYGKNHRLSMALLIGGVQYADQEKLLDRGVDVLIATPGRLMDHFDRGRLLLTDVKVLVIDEADRMLDMGFIPDVERIVSLLPRNRQTLFFSATMPPEIRRLADAFLVQPKEITVARPATTAATVEQHLVVVPAEDKRAALRTLIQAEDVRTAIIFCNRKRDVDVLWKSLKKHGFPGVAGLHGDMPQSARTETLERFKRGDLKLLVASDVAARGLDVADLSHVFNYDVPIHPDDYVHRIGRTGRAGKTGRAFTLATPDDGKFVAAIESLTAKPIPRVDVAGLAAATLDMSARPKRRRGGAAPRPEARPEPRSESRSEVDAPREAAGRREARRPAAGEGGAPERRRERDAGPPERRRGRDDRPQDRPQDRTQDRTQDRGRDRVSEGPRDDRAAARERRPYPVDDAPSPLAFGDHVPAFMLRVPRGGKAV